MGYSQMKVMILLPAKQLSIDDKVVHLSSEELLQPLWITLSAAVKQAMPLELTPKPLLRVKQM